jgi:hypothetical protein
VTVGLAPQDAGFIVPAIEARPESVPWSDRPIG